MNHLPLVTLISLFLLGGCKEFANSTGEDQSRIERINQQITDDDLVNGLSEARKYVKDYPRSAQGWCVLGWAYLKSDELSYANECFDRSLSIDPRFDNAHVGKGAMYRKSGDLQSARASYRKAISIVPKNPEAFSSLSAIEILEGNDQKAVEYGERAWALRKDLATIPANLAIAYHYLGDYSKRDYYYKRAKHLGYSRLDSLRDVFDGKLSIR